ncbi:hypothetical protein pipiens_012265 [Culex pipiens pipiens]|uniref:Uncharacterized protein n=1 Tax=Culex pipiens pipiens TaxID=38569 RepID=A0ABD1D346_CULPP
MQIRQGAPAGRRSIQKTFLWMRPTTCRTFDFIKVNDQHQKNDSKHVSMSKEIFGSDVTRTRTTTMLDGKLLR